MSSRNELLWSETKNRIERAVDTFETAARGEPKGDDYYYTLMEEIFNAVDDWLIENWNNTTALDSECAGEILSQAWREEMCQKEFR